MSRAKFIILSVALAGTALLVGCAGSDPAELKSEVIYTAAELELSSEYDATPVAAGTGGELLTVRETGGFREVVPLKPAGANQNDHVYSGIRLRNCDSVLSFSVLADGGIVFIYAADDVYKISRYNAGGSAVFDTEIGERSSNRYVTAATSLAGETYFVCSTDAGKFVLSVISATGSELYTISGNDVINSVCLLNGETPLVLINGNTLATVNTEKKDWSKRTPLSTVYNKMYGGENGKIYLDNYKELTEYDYAGKISVRLFGWSALGVLPPDWLITTGEDFVIFSAGILYSVLPDTGTGDAETKEIITLASSNPARILSEILAFNNTNSRYTIKVTEYSEDDIDRLLTQMTAGNTPDIFHYSMGDLFTRELSSSKLGAAGYLTDLYRFLDSDKELDRLSFQANILDAAAEGDRLYELPYRFWIDTVAGSASVLGPEAGRTFDEMRAKLEDLSFRGYLFGPGLIREIVLELALFYNMSEYIDWSSGVCRFDSAEFRELLEFVRLYAPESNNANTENELYSIKNGNQLLMRQKVGAKNFLQVFDFFFGDSVFIGFPTSAGVGNSIVYDGSFSVSSATKNAEAAWSFIREFYTPEHYEAEGFFVVPINADALEIYCGIVEEGGKIGAGAEWEDGFTIEFGDTTENDVRRIRELIASLDRVYRVDSTVFDIVWEDAQPFFCGDKSVDEVTAIIQSRIKLYVSEQR